MKLGMTEIILILVLALIVFGGGKLAGVGGALGRTIKDFRNAVKTEEKPDDGKTEEETKA